MKKVIAIDFSMLLNQDFRSSICDIKTYWTHRGGFLHRNFRPRSNIVQLFYRISVLTTHALECCKLSGKDND